MTSIKNKICKTYRKDRNGTGVKLVLNAGFLPHL